MARIKKPKRILPSNNNEKPDILLDEAEKETIDSLSKQLLELKTAFRDQKQNTQNIIIGVLIAFVFVIGTIAVETIIFHTRGNDKVNQEEDFYEIQRDLNEIKLKLDNF